MKGGTEIIGGIDSKIPWIDYVDSFKREFQYLSSILMILIMNQWSVKFENSDGSF